jgi:hypothetical protein
MCREFGLTGLPQPGQPRRLAVVAALEQIVEATAMHVRQRLGQGVVETPVGAGNASALARSTALRRAQ